MKIVIFTLSILLSLVGLLFVLTLFRLVSLLELLSVANQEEGERKTREEPFSKETEPFETASFPGDYREKLFEEYRKLYEEKEEKGEAFSKKIESRAHPLPECFRRLGFSEMPKTKEEVKEKYRKLAKKMHPDVGGDEESFVKITEAYKKAIGFFQDGK